MQGGLEFTNNALAFRGELSAPNKDFSLGVFALAMDAASTRPLGNEIR